MKENLLEIINDVSKEKGLDKEVLIQLVEESIVHAVKRKLPYEAVEGRIHPKTGQIEMFHYKVVVEYVEDSYNEISLEEVRKMDPDAILDDEVNMKSVQRNFYGSLILPDRLFFPVSVKQNAKWWSTLLKKRWERSSPETSYGQKPTVGFPSTL